MRDARARRRARDLAFKKADATGAWHDKARYGVEEGGLAGPIGADQPVNGPGADAQRKLIDGTHGAEAYAQVGDYEGSARVRG